MDERDRQRLEALERENEKLRAELLLSRSGLPHLRWFSRIAWRIGTSFGLGARLREWLQKTQTRRTIPVDETADLAAAVLNRWLIGSLLGICAALVPSIILIWQIFLFREQNSHFREQNGLMLQQNEQLREQNGLLRRQSEQHSDETLRAQRIEYLQALYDIDSDDCKIKQEADLNQTKVTQLDCLAKSNARIRADALIAFVAIERARIKTPRCDPDDQGDETINVEEAHLDHTLLIR